MEWNWAKEQLKQGNKVRRTKWTSEIYYAMKDDVIWTYLTAELKSTIVNDYVANITMEELDADDWELKLYTGYKSNKDSKKITLNKKQREHIAFLMNECNERSKEDLDMKDGCKECDYVELCKSILKDANQLDNGNTPNELLEYAKRTKR